MATWQCYFYVMDGWSVYLGFIPAGDHIICKTYGPASKVKIPDSVTIWHVYIAGLHCKTLCYFKFVEMLTHSIRLLFHYLRF